MPVIHFASDHSINVEGDVRELREKIIAAGAAYTPLIEVTLAGDGDPSVINAHSVRLITKH